MILLYADDPGGANYLAPLAEAMLSQGVLFRFQIAHALVAFAAERKMNCEVRAGAATAESMLADVRLLVTGTSEDPDCFAHRLVGAARVNGIVSVGVVDMAVNADRRFLGRSNNPLQYAPDWLAVTDAYTASVYAALGYPANRLWVCGHPHYDQVRARRKMFLTQDRVALRQSVYPQAPADRPIWLFLAEGVDQLNPAASFRGTDYTLHGRGDNDFRGVIALEEVLDAAAKLNPRPWVALRLHPKNRPEDFMSLVPELGMVSQSGDPLPLLWAADLVLGMTTMLLLEAYLLGRPHFAILPRPVERTWLTTIAEGLTKSVCTRSELRAMLSAAYASYAPDGDVLPKGSASQLLNKVSSLLEDIGANRC